MSSSLLSYIITFTMERALSNLNTPKTLHYSRTVVGRMMMMMKYPSTTLHQAVAPE
jgi:hypothetical protein